METLSAVSNIVLCAAAIYACCIVIKSIREERKMMERRIDMMFPHLIEEEESAWRDPRTQWRPSQKMLNDERRMKP